MSAQIHSKVIVLEKLLCQLNGLSPDTAYKYSIDRKLFDGSIVEVTPWEYIFHGLNSFACRNFDHDDKVVRLQEKYEDIFRGIRLADILDKNYDLYIEMMKEVDTLSQI